MPFKDGKTYITLNCDAGFKDGLVTYGIWISTERGSFKYHGKAEQSYTDSTEGEMIAICTAIKELSKLTVWSNVDILVVNTDSKNAIRMFSTRKSDGATGRFNKFIDYFYNVVDDMQMKRHFVIRFKHVKGHTKVKDARSHVNDWADKMARQIRNEHVQKTQKQK